VSDDYTTVRATGPWRIAVSIGHNDDTLSATLDVTLAVPDITRETPRSVS
jgi:hypothetical protein